MLINNDLFIEFDSCQRIDKHNRLSGDVYLQKRFETYMISVLFSGGDGDSIRQNVTATLLSSAAIKHFEKFKDFDKVINSIIGIVTINGNETNEKLPGFTIVKIDNNSNIDMVCFGMNRPICLRAESSFTPQCSVEHIVTRFGYATTYKRYRFKALVEDRVIFFNKLVVDSSRSGVVFDEESFWRSTTDIILDIIKNNDVMSASDLTRKIILESYNYDGRFKVLGDQSCGVVYFRKPRKVLVCSGPPYNEDKDKYLAKRIVEYDGDTVICGGTTAGIVSRELSREVSVILGRDPSGLPNASSMEGVTMVTEGVLTLGRVKGLLENLSEPIVKGRGIDINLTRLLLNHDVIEFVVGTRINAMHQDPNIPIELELRRNVVKDIGYLLRNKFFKEVEILYV